MADGLYTESVTLVAGKNLLGGHRADTWERNVAATNTTIRGPSVTVGHAKTIVANGITTATLFEGFVVYGGTTFAASGNSYAFWIRNSNAQLTIRDNLVFGGNAGAGGVGSNGGGGGNGNNGQAGERSVLTTSHNNCSEQSNVPGNVADCFDSGGNLIPGACGNGGTNTCSGTSVAGGAGAGATGLVDPGIAQDPERPGIKPRGRIEAVARLQGPFDGGLHQIVGQIAIAAQRQREPPQIGQKRHQIACEGVNCHPPSILFRCNPQGWNSSQLQT